MLEQARACRGLNAEHSTIHDQVTQPSFEPIVINKIAPFLFDLAARIEIQSILEAKSVEQHGGRCRQSFTLPEDALAVVRGDYLGVDENPHPARIRASSFASSSFCGKNPPGIGSLNTACESSSSTDTSFWPGFACT